MCRAEDDPLEKYPYEMQRKKMLEAKMQCESLIPSFL